MNTILSYIFRIGVLGTIVWFAYYVARSLVAYRVKREEDLDYKQISSTLIEAAVKAYGRSTNSIVHLYGQLRYFTPNHSRTYDHARPLVGYVSLPRQNVMITDALCTPEHTKKVILDFAMFTQAQDKDCLLFPIDQITARQAAEIGFGVIQVGKEPVFHLKEYSPDKHDPKILSAIRQTIKKGIILETLDQKSADASRIQKELQEILSEWFLSRRSEKMQLISEVSPFKYFHEKRFFIAKSATRIEAFLSCSPVFARNGYFIHDLIRRPTAMNGISEALTIKALDTFKIEGRDFVSLGVASLAGLGEPGVNKNYPIINKILNRTFNNHEAFMKFKSLYHFKKKFNPTAEEPSYLAFYPPTFKLRHALTIAGMFSGRGLLGDIIFKWKRWKEGTQLPQPLLNFLSPKIAILARPVPFTFSEFAKRLSFTFLMFGLNIFTYMNRASGLGKVSPEALEQYGFSYRNFMEYKWFILVTSNFLHFNFQHLIGNMVLLLIFCGTLEFIGGTTIAALAYLISMNADVPMGVFLLPLIKMFNHDLWLKLYTYLDVGASLGVLGTVGCLLQFLKNKRKLLFGVAVITVALTIIENNYFGVDHTFAVVIGYFVGHLYISLGCSKKSFQKLLVFYDSPYLGTSSIPFRQKPRAVD
jgi:membrane associated rhomboid family serine protease